MHKKLLVLIALLAGVAGGREPSVVSHQQAACSNQRLMHQVEWHRDFDETLALARQQNKPVLWIHLLGDLDGGT